MKFSTILFAGLTVTSFAAPAPAPAPSSPPTEDEKPVSGPNSNAGTNKGKKQTLQQFDLNKMALSQEEVSTAIEALSIYGILNGMEKRDLGGMSGHLTKREASPEPIFPILPFLGALGGILGGAGGIAGAITGANKRDLDAVSGTLIKREASPEPIFPILPFLGALGGILGGAGGIAGAITGADKRDLTAITNTLHKRDLPITEDTTPETHEDLENIIKGLEVYGHLSEINKRGLVDSKKIDDFKDVVIKGVNLKDIITPKVSELLQSIESWGKDQMGGLIKREASPEPVFPFALFSLLGAIGGVAGGASGIAAAVTK